MEGFLESLVEAVIGGLRGGNDTGKEVLANDDLAMLERKRTIAVAEGKRKSDLIYTRGQVAGGVLNRVTDARAVDVQMTIDAPRGGIIPN